MPRFPQVIHDFHHRSVSVVLSDADIVGTRALDDAHLVDVDDDGRAVSIEILALGDMRIDEMAEAFGFSDLVPAIRSAIQSAAIPWTTGPKDTHVVYGSVVAHITTSVRTQAADAPLPAVVV